MAKNKIDNDVVAPALPPTETYSEAESKEQLESPNIIFIGKRMLNGELIAADPPKMLANGNNTYKLPDAQTQLAGFYHKNAGRIVHAFPEYYKTFKKKGAK